MILAVKLGASLLAGVASAPVYMMLCGLSPAQAGASALLGASGFAAALLMPLPDVFRRRAKPIALPDFLDEARGHVASIRRTARSLADPKACAMALKVADAASDGVEALRGRWLAPGPRRVLAYYLPKADQIVRHLLDLERLRAPKPEQFTKAMSTLSALEGLFFRFADDATTPDLKALDREIDLLDKAIAFEAVER